jgi:hypothetical protein
VPRAILDAIVFEWQTLADTVVGDTTLDVGSELGPVRGSVGFEFRGNRMEFVEDNIIIAVRTKYLNDEPIPFHPS